MDHQTSITPHVLIFPLPLQSTINSNLQLAELLCLAGLRVTFLNTNHNQHRLVGNSNVESRFEQYPGFRFLTISDGLPEDHPRSVEQFGDIISSLQTMAEPFLKQMLSALVKEPVTCVILDGLFYYGVDIGNEMGVPVITFDTISPSCFWIYLSLPKLIEAGVLPFKGNDLDALVTHLPAMEGLIRRRDLPHFCLLDYKTDQDSQAVFKEIERLPKAHGLILNSFDDLDGPFLSSVRSYFPKTYAIGPLPLNLKSRLAAPLLSSSNSLWEEDHTSIKWLDEQSNGSVIYVSFGSLLVVSRDEMMEFWHGLMNSKVKFLWVIRPNMLKGDVSYDQFMKELVEGSKGIGYIVSWAPQKMVLAHPSVGGFLTHSGWNSTLESIIEGKPMICWPQYVDQRVTSRLVNEFWKIGLDMKDICDRFVVEKMVKDLMETKKDEYTKSVEKLSKLAKLSVQEGGLSYSNLDCLINDIKGLTRTVENGKMHNNVTSY
ncbi:7-deoxyloganetic acid glucosyltransferase-like [Solanum stenotomum]|uniref:7-deoxyloganetic acid glucosyltransferase-like n=1 Tax=Solanum stenotomum TaxID=172797 RepID=UPI0020D1C58C|nr:7-deoxyloganetic acid glucosyltransferase-like [Solanum stenotomum]